MLLASTMGKSRKRARHGEKRLQICHHLNLFLVYLPEQCSSNAWQSSQQVWNTWNKKRQKQSKLLIEQKNDPDKDKIVLILSAATQGQLYFFWIFFTKLGKFYSVWWLLALNGGVEGGGESVAEWYKASQRQNIISITKIEGLPLPEKA